MRTLTLFFCLFAATGTLAAPSPRDRISYEKTPGFYKGGEVSILEWSAKSQEKPKSGVLPEPVVPISKESPGGLRLRWLGGSGFELSDNETTILIDPFATRPNRESVVNNLPLLPSPDIVDAWVLDKRTLAKTVLILTSSGRHEQIMDVPYILSRYPRLGSRPTVVGTGAIRELLTVYSEGGSRFDWLRGADPLASTHVIVPDQNWTEGTRIPIGRAGAFQISAFRSKSTLTDRLRFPFKKPFSKREPLHAAWYGDDDTLSYLIEVRGLKLFFASSPNARNFNDLRQEVGRVDVLFQGIKGRAVTDRIADTMGALRPRYVVPTHFDNFLEPLSEMTAFEYSTRLPMEVIKYPEFLSGFEPRYYAKAREKAWRWGFFYTESRLRLMKMAYYYSLENLVPPSGKH